MLAKLNQASLKPLIRNGAIIFGACIALDYILYPHWFTFSIFATKWYTLAPFVIAMTTCALLLWRIGYELRMHHQLRKSGNLLIASATSAILIICVPYIGGSTQKSIHNSIVLLFVLFAAAGFALISRQLRNNLLAVISATLVGICALELTLLARYNAHPVQQWVWVVLQLILTPLLIIALYVIANILTKKRVG